MTEKFPGVDGSTGAAEHEPVDGSEFERMVVERWGRETANGGKELVCNGCGDAIDISNGAWELVNDVFWHASCYYENVLGFEPTDDYAPNTWTHKRTVKTEIGDETFEWAELLNPEKGERRPVGYPTWEELTPKQRVALYQMIQENDFGGDGTPTGPDVGAFPARNALFGTPTGLEYDYWTCPTCGHVVDTTEGASKVEATCGHCDTNEWLVRGKPLSPRAVGTLDMLSEREAQVVVFDQLGSNDQAIAGKLNVKPSTVREYRKRAKEKARDGKRLYEGLNDLIDVNNGAVL